MRTVIAVSILFSGLTIGYGQAINTALRDELVNMMDADQAARVKCNDGPQAELVNCYQRVLTDIDVPNTRRLQEIFKRHGLPTSKVAGKEGFQAFMVLLQHSSSDELRRQCLSPIRKAFQRKELPAQDYANFTDRLLLHLGKEQIYGTGFDIKGGKMVMSKTKDLKSLEKRRAKIGLPPLAEYIKILSEMYHMEVVRPRQ